ncbi:hypothetical protein LOD99_11344 [Oopsacas minuta]|uniref:G-protein coupled receptors family 1 profile domain-containing protein n=1 Tax=Oopsacas minuta TaxID=111878 RepID=A0AAV7K5Y0_9METZ|nr:hypothetical protein LOD99_11344 [Oopsacas minuta]
MTFVFCVWFVYLLETIRQKWNSYRSAVGCLHQGENYQIAYNAETEFVKNVFLFLMNIIEWIAFFFLYVLSMVNLTLVITNCHNQTINNDTSYQQYISCLFTRNELNIHSFIYSNSLLLGKALGSLSVILVACLCRYLSARYTRIRWVRSNGIPQIICIFLLYLVVNQLMINLCPVIGRWFYVILSTIALILAVTQVKRLNMVIDWKIADLEKCQKNRRLLIKQIRMKDKFNKIILLLSLGVILLLLSEYVENILLTFKILLHYNDTQRLDSSSCEYIHIDNYIFTEVNKIITTLNYIICWIGTALIFIPYIVYGLATMYVTIWRLVRGRTGYKTHFKGHF